MQAHSAEQTNAIAAAVQNGELDVLTLWAAVRGYAYRKARRWAAALEHRSGQDIEDLMQEAFLAMLRAVRLWRPDGGTGFVGIYEFTLRTAFADACSIRTARTRNDPLQTAVSLDMPVGEDGEGNNTLVDLVTDTQAESQFLEVEREELAEAVRAALQQIPDELREALIGAFWFDKSVDARVRNTALKALRTPTVCQTLRTYV